MKGSLNRNYRYFEPHEQRNYRVIYLATAVKSFAINEKLIAAGLVGKEKVVITPKVLSIVCLENFPQTEHQML